MSILVPPIGWRAGGVAAVEYAGFSSFEQANSAGNINVPLPSGVVAGQALLLIATITRAAFQPNVATPAGWDRHVDQQNTTSFRCVV